MAAANLDPAGMLAAAPPRALLARMRPDPPRLATDPPPGCPRCPRLVAHRQTLQARDPDWFNDPVPSWGDPQGWLAIIGLAPGERGANRTGRPFTGDFAGHLLFETLLELGLATGTYAAHPEDGLTLQGVIITNAVHCLPPANKPTPEEIRTCRPFLQTTLPALPNARILLALGQIAHQSTLKALGAKLPKHPFAHNAVHHLNSGHTLVDSYHCSRYNQNTGRLTRTMFREAVATAVALREQGKGAAPLASFLAIRPQTPILSTGNFRSGEVAR